MATKQLSPTIKSILRLLAFIPLLFVFFCLGYFVLSKKLHGNLTVDNLVNFGNAPKPAALVQDTPLDAPTVVGASPAASPAAGQLIVISNTNNVAAINAMRKKADDQARKRAEAEAQQKADAARRKADEAAHLLTATPAPMATPTPEPDDTNGTTASPDPDTSPSSDANPTGNEETPPTSSVEKPSASSDSHHFV